MKIAILGWGSLIWNPGNLEIKKDENGNFWNKDGPMLPVEFARISKDGRLTLVILKEYGIEPVKTLFAISIFEEKDHAVLDLAVREGCGKNKIGWYYKADDEFFPNNFKFKDEIRSWISSKEEIHAIIWTNLPENFKDKTGFRLNGKNACDYIEMLSWDIKILAEQYVRRTPATIDTKIRKEIENKFEWYKIL